MDGFEQGQIVTAGIVHLTWASRGFAVGGFVVNWVTNDAHKLCAKRVLKVSKHTWRGGKDVVVFQSDRLGGL